ncbi:dual specificity protein phosphatase [Spiroplasma endosymbiont of Diplazon laetatorius]|uniref:dual specificity protein phosphatase family protein n=1 Tax=Spiroplasma endosymbiont of Diplazon laetatorius TaxID=3066322 RepID=UPI0030D45070
MSKKIVDNLFLGDMHSAPSDSELILSCAQEIFEDQNPPKGLNKLVQEENNRILYNFEDYPYLEDMDKSLILDAIQQIENNIKDKKIYVHCIWGINRSASIVFMYLVRNNIIKADSYQEAQKEYWKIYPNHSPNPGWKKFLELNFPYKFDK